MANTASAKKTDAASGNTAAEKTVKKSTSTKAAAKKTQTKAAASKSKAGAKKAVKPAKPYSLVIVESPAKAKTIEKFLGADYKVAASNGHIRDLPKSTMGVDIENNFEPKYIVIRGRASILKELKGYASKAQKVYLATDPDREGEAISWHIANLLELKDEDINRIEFNEITKNAVSNAILHPRAIDKNKVDAQQARRVLDRLVGYKLSPLLWKKVKRGLSAGRVQSVAVRIICDREKEIREFKPEEFWTITALLKSTEEKEFEAKFYGDAKAKIKLSCEADAKKVLAAVEGQDFLIDEVKKGTRKRNPSPPFTTSSLQQDASRKLGFSTKKTMMLAQVLYEGVKVSESDTVGLITYIRTDSTRISDEAMAAAKEHIQKEFGSEYLPAKPNVYKSKKNAQDAHEAIRPTYLHLTPDYLKQYLNADQLKLYRLVYNRFLASQMASANYETISASLSAGGYVFKSSGSRLLFKGYLAVYNNLPEEEEQSAMLPALQKGDLCKPIKIDPKQNFTSPPKRYTEASLVKTLEELGIGRPSTYSPIISTILSRGYIEKQEKNLVPTELGEIVTNLMEKNFADVVDVEFTAQMEEQLDSVESGGKNWKKIIGDFYTPFEKELEVAEEKIEAVKLPERVSDVVCEKCGALMVYKQGRFGEFLACPNYPTCKNTKAIKKTIKTPCPKCGGEIVIKTTKNKKNFYGCANYPECDFVSWDMPLEEKCPKCGAYMVLKRTLKGGSMKKCSNEACETNQKKDTKKNEG